MSCIGYKYSFALKLFSASPSCTSYPLKKKLTIIRVRTYLPWVQYCIQQHNKTTVQLLYPFISTKCALENQTKSPTIEYGYLNFVKKIIRFPVEPLYIDNCFSTLENYLQANLSVRRKIGPLKQFFGLDTPRALRKSTSVPVL